LTIRWLGFWNWPGKPVIFAQDLCLVLIIPAVNGVQFSLLLVLRGRVRVIFATCALTAIA